jgi:fatty acid desaturase
MTLARAEPVQDGTPGWWAHPGREIAPGVRTGGLCPPDALLPDTLPTERLNERGRPVPEVRDQLRRIPTGRNVLNVASVWLQSFGVIALAVWLDNPVMWVATYFLMGRAFALYAILAHEAAHRLLFSKKALNDWAGRWLVGYPAFVPTDIYRRGHMAHHRDEFGPTEPDLMLYANYPITRASLRRKLQRDAFFVSGWKNLKPLLAAATKRESRPLAARILGTQAALWVALTLTAVAGGLPVAFAVLVYPVFWLAPWMSVWRVINRLRAIAEHGGMEESPDRRRTTHHVEQSWLARFWMVPFNTGWHLAHHVDSGVPFQHLPALQRELEAAGWVTSRITYPTYRALWRALSSA